KGWQRNGVGLLSSRSSLPAPSRSCTVNGLLIPSDRRMSNVQSDMFALVLGDSRSLPRGTAKVSYRETYPFLMWAWWKAPSDAGNITIWPWVYRSLLTQEVLGGAEQF